VNSDEVFLLTGGSTSFLSSQKIFQRSTSCRPEKPLQTLLNQRERESGSTAEKLTQENQMANHQLKL